VPRAPGGPRPVLITAGGAGDTPEWQCEAWRAIVRDRGFVLCLRGLPLNPRSPSETGYYYRNHFALEDELVAAIDALRAQFGPAADAGPDLYAGYSQGATMGSLVMIRNPSRLPRAVLVEGGSREWSERVARQFRQAGGQRVLFVCGQTHCFKWAEAARAHLEKAGVQARAVHVEGAGHTYDGAVAVKVRENFEWIVAGDARWGR
jgi:predicted esterase